MDKAVVAGPTGDAPVSATIENGHEEDDIDKSLHLIKVSHCAILLSNNRYSYENIWEMKLTAP